MFPRSNKFISKNKMIKTNNKTILKPKIYSVNYFKKQE